MTTYIYEAYNKDGSITRGEHEGVDRHEVVEYLSKHNLVPISVKRLHGTSGKKGILSMQFFESIKPVDIMFFVRNLATTTKAGLSVVESLDILIEDTEKPIMKKTLQSAQAMIKNGRLLSDGFESRSSSFPPIFMGMLRAGELSGQLDKTLTELGHYLSKEYDLRSKIKSALTYPVILLISSVGVVVLLLMFVLPRLTRAFLSSGTELPLVTKFFLAVSSALTYSFILDFVVLVGVIWFFLYFRTTLLGKKFFFWLLSHTPVASALIKKVALVRFSRTFGNLIGSGLSVIEALELSSQSIGNRSYSLAIEKAIEDIKNGVSLAEAFAKFPNLFPKMLISLMTVGERTGSLQSILLTFADFYEDEVDTSLKDLTSILEPTLLLIMGLLVGSIAFSIILPIYQLVGNFV